VDQRWERGQCLRQQLLEPFGRKKWLRQGWGQGCRCLEKVGALGSSSPCTEDKGETVMIKDDKEIRKKLEFAWAPSSAAFCYMCALSQPKISSKRSTL